MQKPMICLKLVTHSIWYYEDEVPVKKTDVHTHRFRSEKCGESEMLALVASVCVRGANSTEVDKSLAVNSVQGALSVTVEFVQKANSIDWITAMMCTVFVLIIGVLWWQRKVIKKLAEEQIQL